MFPTWSASLPKETSSAALGSAVFRPLPVMVQRAAVNYGLVARAGGGGGGGGREKKDLAFAGGEKNKNDSAFFFYFLFFPAVCHRFGSVLFSSARYQESLYAFQHVSQKFPQCCC